MDTASHADTSVEARTCGIAGKLGYTVACPDGGCALIRALGEDLPADSRVICPAEELARDGNTLVLWTLDELRREMEERPSAWHARGAQPLRGAHHADVLRRWS